MQKNSQKVKIVHIERRIPLEAKNCLHCGKRFEGIKKARYCSRACVQKASYERNIEARRKGRMEAYYAQKAAKKTHGKQEGKEA